MLKQNILKQVGHLLRELGNRERAVPNVSGQVGVFKLRTSLIILIRSIYLLMQLFLTQLHC